MKILHLKFKNINSLADVSEIDFTAPQFTENGLFAITGKTGSGKSSILDAISLALYGKTPRVEITGQNNDVMTHGSSDCYSEIIFETNGKQWKSSWKQERTRTGNLKPVNRLIADKNDTIIADQIRTCDSKIQEILGLSFEQFTKVIMLAQGSFTAFLQAEKNEKGELLEQITGTEIYGIISEKVYNRNKLENEKLQTITVELGAINILSDEDIEKLQKDISALENDKQLIDKEIATIEAARKWLEDISNLQQKISETKNKLPESERSVASAKILLDESEKALKIAKEEQTAIAPILIKTRELDIKIALKNNAIKPLVDSIKTLNAKITQANSELTNKKQLAGQIQAEIDEKNILLQSKNAELNSRKDELTTLLNGKDIAYYHSEKENITNYGIEIKNLIDNLQNILANIKKLSEYEDIIVRLNVGIANLKDKIPVNQAIAKDKELQIRLLRENIALLETIKSLDEHRKSLEDGKECPLCGAIEHPFAKGNVPQIGDKNLKLKALEDEFRLLTTNINENEKLLTKQSSSLENALQNRKNIETNLSIFRENITRISGEIAKLGKEHIEISEDDGSIEKLQAVKQQELQKYRAIETILKSSETMEKDIVNLRDSVIPKITSNIETLKNNFNRVTPEIAAWQTSITETEKQIDAQKTELQQIESEKNELEQQRKTIFGDKSVEKEEFRLKNLLEKSEMQKNNAEKFYNNSKTEFAEIQAIITEKEKELSTKIYQKTTEKSDKDLLIALTEKKQLSNDLSQKIGANLQSLKANEENSKLYGKKMKNRELQRDICNKWGRLNELIGSADGKKYRNFAQALTFEHLIGLANRQLFKMSDRYLLKRSGDATNPFELSVIDKFQNCEERTAQNLSGGEKFIVSLALALGLANMASKNMRIDTMFIDEGFGTLDSDYLDVALSALSSLQSEGKLIGVISHLTELKERIATHIEVVPCGNGFSKILPT